MTRMANARTAGFTFLFYIAAGITSMVLSARTGGGEEIAAKLAGIAQHATEMRISFVLSLLTCFCALVLGVTLYAITREQDPDLAMMGLTCRIAEGVIAASLPVTLALIWLATSSGADAPDTAAFYALGAFMRKLGGWHALTCATFFSVGSTLFSWLLLRGRMIPVPLARLGVFASVLLVICLPLQLTGFLGGRVTSLMWIPMALFEIPLAFWLMIRGVAVPARIRASS
jgi:Domain of unknown function (DUF4386)